MKTTTTSNQTEATCDVAKLARYYATPPISPLGQQLDLDFDVLGHWKLRHLVMDNDPSRRHYAPTSYALQQQQPSQAAGPSTQYATSGAGGRFRQTSYIPQSPSSTMPPGRAGADTTPYYGFEQGAQYSSAGPLQQSPIQYTQEMPSTEAQRQQTQHFSQYQGNILYGMPQPQGPQTPQASYDHQYRQRPSTGSETLATQFGVPQNAQYYLAAQAGPASAAAPNFPAQPLPPQYQQHDPYAQSGPSASQVYAGAMMDPSSSSHQTFGQQSQYLQQQAQNSDQAIEDYQRSEYHRTVRQIATLAHDGTLREADQYLLRISQYLLGNAERLELTKDDSTQHDDRIRLWDEFNRTWLTALQRQHDLTEDSIQSGRGLREPQSIMSVQILERLAQELIKLCDNVERHGLVDYQMGVAEEEIIELLLRCIELLDPNDVRTSEPESAAGLRGR